MKTIAERLRYARETHKKWPQTQLATAAGVSQSTIGNIESGIRQGRGSLPAIAKALGISHDWLADGEGPMVIPTPQGHHSGTMEPHSSYATPAESPPSGAIRIPLLINSASMGAGVDGMHEDVVVGHLLISPTWIERRISPSSSKALRFIHAYGDSMQPTFSDGDVLLVDTGIVDPSQADGVYVLESHNSLFIKRVSRRLDGGFDVTSDNTSVKTVSTLNGNNDVRILGRVVWTWNGKKL